MPYAYVASIDTADSFSDFYRFQAISTRDAIISSWKLYVLTFHLWYWIKFLMHLLTIVYVNIELWCKCWYCWISFLTVTRSRPFRRGTPSPVENCMYLPSIYKYSIKCLMHMLQVLILLILFSDFYRFQAILTKDAIITSWKLYVFTLHL